MRKLSVAVLIAFLAGMALQAQTEGPRLQYVLGTVSGCSIVSGQSVFCLTTGNSTTPAALYVSSMGGTFTQLGAQGPVGPAGAQGIQGIQGPQGPAGTSTAGVASLNGHTGALTMTLGSSPVSITP